jgi:hypothetical protein
MYKTTTTKTKKKTMKVKHNKLQDRGVQIPGTKSPLRINFLLCAPNICGSSVWNFLHVTLLAPRIWWWPLHF